MAVDASSLMMFDEFCCLMMCCHDSLLALLYDLRCVVMCFDGCWFFILSNDECSLLVWMICFDGPW